MPPKVTDAKELANQWLKWWVSLQPTARRIQDVQCTSANLTDYLTKPSSIEPGGWDQLCAGGPNGLFLFFVMLSWLRQISSTERDVAFYDVAMVDVEWALSKILLHLNAHTSATDDARKTDGATLTNMGHSSKRRR